MDEMKIVSKFTRGLLSKIASITIKKKTGYDVKIQLNNFTTTVNEGKTHLHLDIDAEMDKYELVKILKKSGFDVWGAVNDDN